MGIRAGDPEALRRVAAALALRRRRHVVGAEVYLEVAPRIMGAGKIGVSKRIRERGKTTSSG